MSADPARRDAMSQASRAVLDSLQKAGLKAERSRLGTTAGYAESPPVPGKPVVLVYRHTMSTPDPLDLWITPPFEPTEREGNLFARGSTDDKGQMLTHVNSVAAWAAAGQPLPLK